MLKYPGRFMIGSDTWVNQRWQYYDDLMRPTAPRLARDAARRIAWENGATLFGVKTP